MPSFPSIEHKRYGLMYPENAFTFEYSCLNCRTPLLSTHAPGDMIIDKSSHYIS